MNDEVKDGNLRFRTTSAVDDADVSGYEVFLNQILENEKTRNVAITGTYGSGKSSILNSYEKKYQLEKDIHRIQIASFGAEDFSDEQIELKLEKRIINNLRVAVPNMQLKGTGLYTPENITQKDIENLLSWGVLSVIPLLGIKYLYLGNFISFLLSLIVLLFAGMTIFNFLQILSKSQLLAKVSFDKISIDMNKSDVKTSDYFDDFMNDVINAFANLGVKYVVFEDLDRFENKYIFERLREINILLNNVVEKRIVFIYLIRNDLFTETEMSKFFDSSIPVVPVLDISNAYSRFLTMAKDDYELDIADLNSVKLGEIFEFIHDMRLLITILNDYQLFSYLFSTNHLSKTKLLALMVYKNVFPKDFSLAQNGQGVLAKAVSLREDIRREKIEKINIERQKQEEAFEDDDMDNSLERAIKKMNLEIQATEDMSFEELALMLDLRTDFSLPCKLIAEEHFLYDSIFTRI